MSIGHSLDAELPDRVPREARLQSHSHLRDAVRCQIYGFQVLSSSPPSVHASQSAKQAPRTTEPRRSHRAGAVGSGDDLRVAELEPVAAMQHSRISSCTRSTPTTGNVAGWLAGTDANAAAQNRTVGTASLIGRKSSIAKQTTVLSGVVIRQRQGQALTRPAPRCWSPTRRQKARRHRSCAWPDATLRCDGGSRRCCT